MRLQCAKITRPCLTPHPGSESGSAASEVSTPLVQGAGIALSSSSSYLTRRLEEVDTSGPPSPRSSPTPSPTLSPTPAPECINHNVCGTPEYWERQDRIVYSSLISVACVLCACFSACGCMDWRNTRVESRKSLDRTISRALLILHELGGKAAMTGPGLIVSATRPETSGRLILPASLDPRRHPNKNSKRDRQHPNLGRRHHRSLSLPDLQHRQRPWRR
ncbi:unnamed protein product [Ectocarpus sp. 12 AP-2014]